ANYAVPSMFLDELPAENVESIDLSASAGGSSRAIEEWRSGSRDAEPGWRDAGVLSFRAKDTHANGDGSPYVEGMMVRHERYGPGRVTEVSGYGAMRKIKVRFSSAGERTFLAEKAKLAIVRPE
ncbi:MAG TPA: ATP-dependent DNA helicase, partial [Gemmataceae bacterium]|nr:ATP-dependent DNA helicase [Gemmataceae bacterium]